MGVSSGLHWTRRSRSVRISEATGAAPVSPNVMPEEREQPAPVFQSRGLLPRALHPAEAWVSVALCCAGAAVPLFSGATGGASIGGHGVMLAILVIGFAAGINVLAGRTS